MVKFIVIIILVLFLVYMLIWTVRLNAHTRRKAKMRRIHELREKKEGKSNQAGDKIENKKEVVSNTLDISKDNIKKEDKKLQKEDKNLSKDQFPKETEHKGDYWVNLHELRDCVTDNEKEKCYHYFKTVEEGFHGLLLELYDYGLVRIDELETIAYGKTSFENVDLSFLDEIEERQESNEVMNAAKALDQKDPGITDIRGTLSDGVEKVIKAVEKEKEIEAKKNEPISVKEETSVEKARSDRAKTSNQEIRNKIFLKWDHYIDDLYEMVEIKASDDMKHKIKKALRDYGYNDVDVLLKSPE
ncbi:MAG: hypothetical protein ACI4F4_07605 [Lachnospiraceae bacterium]